MAPLPAVAIGAAVVRAAAWTGAGGRASVTLFGKLKDSKDMPSADGDGAGGFAAVERGAD